MKYLKDFIIGSSIIVVLPHYYKVYFIEKYKDKIYIILAPLWFGLWNIISLIIADRFKLSKRLRFFVVSILSLLSVFIIAQYLYTKTKEEWSSYYLKQFLIYMIIWNIIIYNINKYI